MNLLLYFNALQNTHQPATKKAAKLYRTFAAQRQCPEADGDLHR